MNPEVELVVEPIRFCFGDHRAYNVTKTSVIIFDQSFMLDNLGLLKLGSILGLSKPIPAALNTSWRALEQLIMLLFCDFEPLRYPKQKQGIKLSIVTAERATAEATETVSVKKANMEARLEAERVAAQRVQTEARERKSVERAQCAAREAKEKEAREKERIDVAKAQTEARPQMEACKRPKDRVEQTAPDAQEKEAQEKERVAAKAQTEARRRAERAAVERAAAEARKRAATKACEKASMEARLKAERVAMQRAQIEARERPRERA
ncbi:hypothetical protein E3N88_32039 [Mikania micrantha]|uniref:Uncharacterized protein n=1 Tax=Mikania micrantha TaxID=192012 RepID=A0A5N6M7D4_9ASTR|nr:hypothetical protein E3N88_32039 [Mikania micrantha]